MVIRICIDISDIHYFKSATRRDIIWGYFACSETQLSKNISAFNALYNS